MLDTIIPKQGFELIRDQILAILMTEFKNQINQFNNQECVGVNFFAERSVPMDKSEQDFVNVSLFKGDYGNQEQDYVEGTYQFLIEIVAGGKSRVNEAADKMAHFRVQKLTGIIRYILQSSYYKTLAIDPPFILHTELSKIQIYKPTPGSDVTNMSVGQSIFTVRCGETTNAIRGLLVGGADTSVRIDLTNKGYRYAFIEEGPTPPNDPRFVTILNQFDEVLALIPGGNTYTVEQLQEIIDDIIGNETTIIEKLS